MEELVRESVVAKAADWAKENNYHVEMNKKSKNRLLVSEDRTQWIPFSKRARQDGAKNLVIAWYKAEDGESFLLVSLPGELNTNYEREEYKWI